MRKGQTAMEYLMTYGWAILIIMVVLAVLFYLGVMRPPIPLVCTFPAGFTCTTNKLSANSGSLTLEVGQATGKVINVTGVTCTMNNSATYTSTASIVYTPANFVILASGNKAFIADNRTGGPVGINSVVCTNANNQAMGASATIGSQYNGKIYINYTEVDTTITRIAVGTYSANFEA